MMTTSKLYVGGLPYQTTQEELTELFATIGPVKSASIIMDQNTGSSKGFGFVEMMELADAEKALTAFGNNYEFGGRTLIVNEARPREERKDYGNGPRNNNYSNRDSNRGGGSRY